jgi:hypothetical protein
MARKKTRKNGVSSSSIKPLTLTLGKVEYSDGSTWYPLASESWVENTTDQRLDKYQTLNFTSSMSWNATLGNVAFLTLSGNCVITNISWNTAGPSTLTLFAKQDANGNRSLNISNIYRAGNTSTLMPLSSTANAVDCLIFKISGEIGKLYLVQVVNNFQLTNIT